MGLTWTLVPIRCGPGTGEDVSGDGRRLEAEMQVRESLSSGRRVLR
jgi:hypothetical protein